MNTTVRPLEKIMQEPVPALSPWNIRAVMSEECMSFVAWNEESKEALVIDPKKEDLSAYLAIARDLTGYRWIGVFDTHTHADHISVASDLAKTLQTSVIMHVASPTPRAHLKVNQSTQISSSAGPVYVLSTPGHTPDSITVLWGPYLFGGDTLLFGDVGRDDLPGGNPEAHYQSIQLIKKHAKPEMILLPGHDHKGGRASTWKYQLEVSTSLTQPHDDFVREAASFTAPAPKLLKESLFENFK